MVESCEGVLMVVQSCEGWWQLMVVQSCEGAADGGSIM